MSKVKCSKISVDCIHNDPVDIRAGGAEILGYDFFVDEKDAERLVTVIEKAIHELQLPLMGISIQEKGRIQLEEEKVWKDERILQCIVDQSDVIISEATRRNVYQKQQ